MFIGYTAAKDTLICTLNTIDTLAVYSPHDNHFQFAKSLADQLSIPLTDDAQHAGYLLIAEPSLPYITNSLAKSATRIFIDFCAGSNRHRQQFGGGKNQTLARAVGLNKNKQLHVLDATGGFAADAFVFASLGAKVCLLERNPVMHFLIEDGLRRAAQVPNVASICTRINLQLADAGQFMATLPIAEHQPDVVYLDPMYPQRGKTASVKKNMAFLHQLLGSDPPSDDLLLLARRYSRKRVVVKRPKNAPYLEGQTPSGELTSTNTRYDIYSAKRD